MVKVLLPSLTALELDGVILPLFHYLCRRWYWTSPLPYGVGGAHTEKLCFIATGLDFLVGRIPGGRYLVHDDSIAVVIIMRTGHNEGIFTLQLGRQMDN